nr:hypothetical protein [uncultured Halomonas sp.]
MTFTPKLIGTGLLAALLAGCSMQGMHFNTAPHEPLPQIPERPTAAWVETHLPAFAEVARDYPTTDNIARFKTLEAMATSRNIAQHKLNQIDRQLTMAYDNFGRGGAAVRQPGYVHVVNQEFNTLRAATGEMSRDTLASELAEMIDGLSEAKALEVIDAINAGITPSNDPAFDWIVSDASTGYSMYELSRWGRYCNGGKGMDEADWQFVNLHGAKGVPSMFEDCTLPTYTYFDYTAAWERFCEGEASRQDRDIVRDSVRPTSTVQHCSAMDD